MDFRTRGLKEDDSAVIPRPETEAGVDGERAVVESVARYYKLPFLFATG